MKSECEEMMRGNEELRDRVGNEFEGLNEITTKWINNFAKEKLRSFCQKFGLFLSSNTGTNEELRRMIAEFEEKLLEKQESLEEVKADVVIFTFLSVWSRRVLPHA